MLFRKSKRLPSALHSSLGEKRKLRTDTFMRGESKKNRFPLLLLFVLPVLVCILLYVLFFVFSVQHIYCTDSENSSCPPQLLEELQHFQGKPLIFLQINDQDSEKLIRNLQQFDHLDFVKKFPDTLQFTAHKSPPAYILIVNQEHFLIAKSGKATQIEQPLSNIPQIHTVSDLVSQDTGTVNEHTHSTIEQLLDQISKQKLEVFQLTWNTENEIVIELQSGKKIILKSEQLEEQFQKITTILNREIEVKDWDELDVRFQHPVVR